MTPSSSSSAPPTTPLPIPLTSIDQATKLQLAKEQAALAATIAALEAGTQGSNSTSIAAFKEFKRANKKRGKRVVQKPCVGAPGCTKLMCDHTFLVKDKKAVNKDSRILDGLLQLCEKNGIPVSAAYAIKKLEQEGGLMMKAYTAIKYDLEQRRASIESAGRISITFEMEQSRRYEESIRNAHPSTDPVLLSRRCLPTNLDEFYTTIEFEDKSIAETLTDGWNSAYGKALKQSHVYKTRQSRDNAMNMYREEARWREARSKYYKQIHAESFLRPSERELLVEKWEEENLHPRPKDNWAGSPFRLNHDQVVTHIENRNKQSQAGRSGKKLEQDSQHTAQQATVEDGSDGDSIKSDGTDPDVKLERIIQKEQLAQAELNEKLRDVQAHYDTMIHRPKPLPYNHSPNWDEQQDVFREVVKIAGRQPEMDAATTALRLLTLELMDKNHKLKSENLDLRSKQIKSVIIESFSEFRAEDSWNIDEFLAQLSATSTETWSYETRVNGFRTVNIEWLIATMAALKYGLEKIFDLLMKEDHEAVTILDKFLGARSLFQYVEDLFESDQDEMDDECVEVFNDVMDLTYDIDMRVLILRAFHRDPITAKYTLKDRAVYDILQETIKHVLEASIIQYNNTTHDPERLERAYKIMKEEEFIYVHDWVTQGMFPIPEGDDYIELMNVTNIAILEQMDHMCNVIQRALHDRWPDDILEIEENSVQEDISELAASYNRIIQKLPQNDEAAAFIVQNILAGQSTFSKIMLTSRINQRPELVETVACIRRETTIALEADIQLIFGIGVDALNDSKENKPVTSLEYDSAQWKMAAEKIVCFHMELGTQLGIIETSPDMLRRFEVLTNEDRNLIRPFVLAAISAGGNIQYESDHNNGDEDEIIKKKVAQQPTPQPVSRKVEMSLYKQLGHAQIEAKSKKIFGVSFHKGLNNLLLESKFDFEHIRKAEFRSRFKQMIENPPQDDPKDAAVSRHDLCTLVINAAGVKFPLCAHDHSEDILIGCHHATLDQPPHATATLHGFQRDLSNNGMYEAIDIEMRKSNKNIDENGKFRSMSVIVYRQNRYRGNMAFDMEFSRLSASITGDKNLEYSTLLQSMCKPSNAVSMTQQQSEPAYGGNIGHDEFVVEIFDSSISSPPVYDTKGNAIYTGTAKLYEKLDAINRRIFQGRLSTQDPDPLFISHVCSCTNIKSKLWAEMLIKLCDGSAAHAVSYYEEIQPIIMKYLETSDYLMTRAYCEAVGLEFGHLTLTSRLQEHQLLSNQAGPDLNASSSSTPVANSSVLMPSNSSEPILGSCSAEVTPKEPKQPSKKAAKAAAKKAANDAKGRGGR